MQSRGGWSPSILLHFRKAGKLKTPTGVVEFLLNLTS
jgi:hypothetical protein